MSKLLIVDDEEDIREFAKSQGHKTPFLTNRLAIWINRLHILAESDPNLQVIVTADHDTAGFDVPFHMLTTELPLENDTFVVSERYYHSTIAYQEAQGVDRKWLIEINKFAVKPDMTIFLDIGPETGVKRTKTEEIFENTEFLEKVRDNFVFFPAAGTGRQDYREHRFHSRRSLPWC